MSIPHKKIKIETIGFYDSITRDIFLTILDLIIPLDKNYPCLNRSQSFMRLTIEKDKRKDLSEFLKLREVDKTFKKWINDYLFGFYEKEEWFSSIVMNLIAQRNALLIFGQDININIIKEKLPAVYRHITTTDTIMIDRTFQSIRCSLRDFESITMNRNVLFYIFCFGYIDHKKLAEIFYGCCLEILRFRILTLEFRLELEYLDNDCEDFIKLLFFNNHQKALAKAFHIEDMDPLMMTLNDSRNFGKSGTTEIRKISKSTQPIWTFPAKEDVDFPLKVDCKFGIGRPGFSFREKKD